MVSSGLNKILIGIDGSHHSMQAVHYMSDLVRKDDVEIVLFHVMRKIYDPFIDMGIQADLIGSSFKMEEWEKDRKLAITDVMDRACDVLTKAGIPGDRIHIKIQQKKTGIARDIIAEAQNGYCAVVVGRRGISKIKDLIMGSIAIKVIERIADIPVCVVGDQPDSRRILVGVDASQNSQRSIDFLKLFFPYSPEQILLVKVIRGIDIFRQETYTFEFPGYDKLIKDSIEKCSPFLENGKKDLVNAGFNLLTVRSKIIKDAYSRAEALVDEAKREDFGTIVVGRKGISRVGEFLLGRVSTKVIHLAKNMAVWVVN